MVSILSLDFRKSFGSFNHGFEAGLGFLTRVFYLDLDSLIPIRVMLSS